MAELREYELHMASQIMALQTVTEHLLAAIAHKGGLPVLDIERERAACATRWATQTVQGAPATLSDHMTAVSAEIADEIFARVLRRLDTLQGAGPQAG
jgi:hypothetical protein